MMDREFNFNKDITYLEKQNEWFFVSNLPEEKNVFSYTQNLSLIKEELKLSGILKNNEIYDEFESIYIDFKDRTEAKKFIKNINSYIEHCSKNNLNSINTINTIEELEKNVIINKRISTFHNIL
jgi:hypothetical protein